MPRRKQAERELSYQSEHPVADAFSSIIIIIIIVTLVIIISVSLAQYLPSQDNTFFLQLLLYLQSSATLSAGGSV